MSSTRETHAPHPPLAPLQRACARLAAAGIPQALGTSGLLYSMGLVDHVNDWDVTCDAELETLQRLFADEPTVAFGSSGIHADAKLQIAGGSIELIANYAFFVPGGVVRIPTIVGGSWNGVATGTPEVWAAAYWLMGHLEDVPRRRERAERVFEWLLEHGADGAVLARLFAEPLPAALAARLAALPKRD